MKDEELIDLLWKVKEGKTHPNRAYKKIKEKLDLVAESTFPDFEHTPEPPNKKK